MPGVRAPVPTGSVDRGGQVGRAVRLAASVVVLGLLAGGCGGGGGDAESAADFAEQDAAEIVEAAEAATTGADSLRLTGELGLGEQTVSLDLSLDQDGGCTGTFGQGEAEAELVGVDGSYWFRPDDAYWRTTLGEAAAAPVIEAQQGRWVANDGLETLCDPAQLLGSAADDPDVQLAVLGTEEEDGQEVVRVRRTDAAGQSTVSSVLVSDPHYLVRVVGEGEADDTRIELGGFGDELDPTAPAAEDQVPLADLPLG